MLAACMYDYFTAYTNLSRLRCRYLLALLKLYNAPRLKPNLQRILFLAGTKLIKILPRKI